MQKYTSGHVQSVFITGGASGIGYAAVKRFYEAGAFVFFTDIDEELSHQVTEALEDQERIGFSCVDVSDATAMQRVVKEAVEKFGYIDTVFANAGVHFRGDALSTSVDEWQSVMRINLDGIFYTVKYTLPELLRHGRGTIILNGSDQSLIGKKNSFAYGASKGAIGQMTKSLALDYAEKNIRVNCVCPATIDTPLAQKAVLNAQADRKDLKSAMRNEALLHPLGRVGLASEVADAVFYLASNQASFITGILLPVDGGYTAQ